MPGVDWGLVYTKIVAHTNVGYFDIPELPIPGLHAILKNLPDEINLKRSLFFGYKNPEETESANREEEHTTNDGMAFAALFAGLG